MKLEVISLYQAPVGRRKSSQSSGDMERRLRSSMGLLLWEQREPGDELLVGAPRKFA